MKKFITVSVLALSVAVKAFCCAIEKSDYKYYMFSVYQRECMDPAYLESINSYWKKYSGASDNMMSDYYKWCKDDVYAAAKKKNDAQMMTYLKWLNLYISSCGSNDSWDYPTKAELQKRRQTLVQVLNAAKAYKGERLKQQYALLRMRANMVLGYDKSNVAYWTSSGSKLPASCWKEAMRNIYARALLKEGNRLGACDIYAAQGDMSSIRWAARNYRNLAGIQSIYAKNPTSESLTYLVQDFVNNFQQTIDLNPKTADDKEYFKLIGAKTVYRDEALKFIDFADNVADGGKTKVPCLWKSASAMLHYLIGESAKALEDINDAMSLEGTPRMKDNARAIRLLILTGSEGASSNMSDYLVGELRWLDDKIVKDRGKRLDFDNHYTNVKERIVYCNLVPWCFRNGKSEMATALCGMMQKYGNDFCPDATKYLDRAYGNYSDYTCRLDTMTAEETEKYYRFISNNHTDPLESYVCGNVYCDAEFFDDMIGTKYLAEGNFGKAENFLQRLSSDFIAGQRINFYMSQRSYSVERWFYRQKAKDEEGFLYVDFSDKYGKSASNQKLQFCRDMLSLQNQYNITREGEKRDELAYSLAVHYYQASCYGDCWYLTHYGKSVMDSARSNEKDFANEAIKYLTICKESKNMNLRYKALYALAFIPVQPWYAIGYDNNYNEIFIPQHNAMQYKAMAELELFASQHPENVDDYTTKCDVLKRFMASNR